MKKTVVRSWAKLMSWFKEIPKWLFLGPAKVHESDEYVAAYQFKDGFEPGDGDYEWIGEYASFLYERLQNSHDKLDSKAESLMTLLGGGSGLLTAGLISQGVALNWGIILASAIAFLGLIAAARVRLPGPNYLPPSVAHALRYVPYFKEKSASAFLAQWHLACEASRVSLARKAQGVFFSTCCAVAAVFFLLVSMATPFFYSSPKSAEQVVDGNTKTKQVVPSEPIKLAEPKATQIPRNETDNQPMNEQTEQPGRQAPPVPDPATQPQTPTQLTGTNPAIEAGPQEINKDHNPATNAGPQTLTEGKSGK